MELLINAFVSLVLALVLLFMENGKSKFVKKNHKFFFILAIFLTLVLAIFNFYLLYDDSITKRYENNYGIISGVISSKTNEISICLGEGVCYKYFIADFDDGGEKVFMSDKNMDAQLNGIYCLMDDIIIGRHKDSLYVTLSVRDRNGNIIASVNKNEWNVNNNRILDKNFDDKSFEVLNERGEVVLKIKNEMGRMELEMMTYLICPELNRGIMTIVKNKDNTGTTLEFIPYNSTNYELIEPYFRYPSLLHKGEPNQNNYK